MTRPTKHKRRPRHTYKPIKPEPAKTAGDMDGWGRAGKVFAMAWRMG